MNVDQNKGRDIWLRRLRLRKNSFSSSGEPNNVKHGQTETSEKHCQNVQTLNDSINKLMSCCSVCKDDITFSPTELSEHYKIIHAGKAPVFSVMQGCNDNVQQTFPQHCHDENICKVDLKSQVLADAAGEEQEGSVADCRHRWSRKKWWIKRDHEPDHKLSQEFKFLLPKPEAQWTPTVLPMSAPGLLDSRGVFLDPEKTLQETQQFLEKSAGKKWPVFLKTEIDQIKPFLRDRPNDVPNPELISGLMEKKNVSVPPDYTSKVLGIKMVDGKKHLILKIIPSNKRHGSELRKLKDDECQTSKNSSDEGEMRSKQTLSFSVSQSQENSFISQRDSRCHSDVPSNTPLKTGSWEERIDSLVSEKEFQCSDMTNGAIEISSRHMFFHNRDDDRSTNNTILRDVQVPEDECEYKRLTITHSLDTDLTSASYHHITDAQGINQPCEHIYTDISSTPQKRVLEVLLNTETVCESQKTWSPEESDVHWEPVPRDVPRSLRLRPHRSSQFISIPRDNQPVVVLNHPDPDIPEVINIMKVIHKHKGSLQRVILSRKTLRALSDCERYVSHCRRAWPDGTVKERFSLKLRLKRVCGRKFTVVPTAPESITPKPTFRCWFCGRVFKNQEVWIGHGQRHLTEATKGWNHIYST